MNRLATQYIYLPLILLLCIVTDGVAQQKSYIQTLGEQNYWVDSVYNKLTRRQKVAQLFMVRAHTNLGQKYIDSVGKVIHKEHVGGVVFFQGGPGRQAAAINKYQKLSKVPLLIAQDGEWGLGMRLDSTLSYPYQMTLGAIQDNKLIYKMGQRVGYEFKRLGMHMNFGPVMDINNNPENPVINYRSFGDNKYNVAQKGIAYLKGMQDAGLLTTAKHYPGHGDTNVDSHVGLPTLPFTRGRLDSLEEYPFKQAIAEGVSGIMVAHMSIPAMDTTKNLASTLSRKIITDRLKDTLGFKGLVVSDGMEMHAVTKYFPHGEAELKAFLAGNDIIELSTDLHASIIKIKKAVRKHQIDDKEFEAKVKRVLAAKYWAGLNTKKVVPVDNVFADLNSASAKNLIQELSDGAVTLLRGDAQSLQLNPLLKTALISVGVDKTTTFQAEMAKWYTNSNKFIVNKSTPVADLNRIIATLKDYDQVFVSIHDSRTRPASKLDYSAGVKQFIAALPANKNTVMSVFANAYAIAGLPGIEKSVGLLACYQNSEYLQLSAVKAITGQLKPTGRLPVSVNVFFPTGTGAGYMQAMP